MQVNARSTHALASPDAAPPGDQVDGSLDDWRLEALCAQSDPESFFPDKGGSARAALEVCERCPVRAECLNFALENDERFGIWGGTTERQRRELRRQQQEARDGVGHVPGLTARGDDKWAVGVKYRRPDGGVAQLATTVSGPRAAAFQRLAELRARAAHLAGEQSATAVAEVG
jgi:WhiB family transcriptional regulator, redox-sensing transcriptional regulator